VTSVDELKLRIVVEIETVTPKMLENTWREIEYGLDILRAKKVRMLKFHSIMQY
jgi:hypothetical protein